MFDALVVAYLFLGGAGAALGALLALLTLSEGLRAVRGRSGALVAAGAVAGRACGCDDALSAAQRERFLAFGNILSAAVCLLGALCLLFDMERPDKVLVLLLNPNGSIVAVGAYALFASLMLSALSGILRLYRPRSAAVVFGIVSVAQLASACVTMTYTALLLMAFKGVAFFQTWTLVGLFVCSSVACGLALAALAGMVLRVFPLERGHGRTVAAEAVVAVAEALFLGLFMAHASAVSTEAFSTLVFGPLAWVFWIVVVGCGIGSPVAAWGFSRFVRGYRLHGGLSPVLVLLAGFALRFCIVAVV